MVCWKQEQIQENICGSYRRGRRPAETWRISADGCCPVSQAFLRIVHTHLRFFSVSSRNHGNVLFTLYALRTQVACSSGVYSSALPTFSLLLPRTLFISLWVKTANGPNGEIAFLRSKNGCRLGAEKGGKQRWTFWNLSISGVSKNNLLLFFVVNVNLKWPFLYF